MREEKVQQFAYSFQAASDCNGFILGTIVTRVNTRDNVMLEPLVEQVIEKIEKHL